MDSHEEEEDDDHIHSGYSPYCPSFNSYCNSNKITEIATRVAGETPTFPNPKSEVSDDDNGFEFDLAGISSQDAGFREFYPVFDRNLLQDLESEDNTVRIQLRELFLEEDGDPRDPSAISSSVDELPEISTAAAYCVWAPKSPSPSRCTKSNSIGSAAAATAAPVASKTWRLRNLLRRCKSDGKEGLVLLTPMKKKEKPAPAPATGDGEGYYRNNNNNNNHNNNNSHRRRSYLPYKQDLLGFFTSPQTLRRINLPPF